MIIVLDTNVIVSALLSPLGSPAEIINRWEADEFDVVVSSQLLSELERVIKYPGIAKYIKLPQKTIDSFLRHFVTAAILVEPQFRLEVIDEDPADNRVLECAFAGNASYIVTGDKHLLKLKEYQGIIILPPSGFLTFLKMEEKKGS